MPTHVGECRAGRPGGVDRGAGARDQFGLFAAHRADARYEHRLSPATIREAKPHTVSGLNAYLLCATPRSGSTLLCGLLCSTGIAGRPESYFRREDLGEYADSWRLPGPSRGAVDAAYVRAAVAAGSTSNGIFGARIMWGTMEQLTEALRTHPGDSTAPDLHLLTEAFGDLRFVHLRRADAVAQAVSWARAEQTHFWHPGEQMAPGGQEPHYDPDLMRRLVDRITAYEAAWQRWFTRCGVVPHDVAYEDLAANPIGITHGVLAALGLVLPSTASISIRDRRQADAVNLDWITRFRG